ncbi:hypothetical protein [Serratia liquefaciens]|uniref:Uncharacterized protein n=1 Tax=Serratia liquefaciens TaxID=614 RepID=A0A515D2N2_SERLI|nr:hypothetical protein [Serratia liquefaciens]QDL34656.1 hypothetical protein EGO53_24065 [Serratia liquefaciens]
MKINSSNRSASTITVTVDLNIKAGFTGMVVVQMENGVEKAQFPLRRGEFFGSLESFLNAAHTAGYQVIPPVVQVTA